jgi:hypothetical protein
MRIVAKASLFRSTVVFLAILLGSGAATAGVTSIDVDPNADLSPQRDEATINGSIGCDLAEAVDLVVYVIQTGGRLLNIGIANDNVTCADQGGNFSAAFSIPVPAIDGLNYRPGPATVLVKANSTSNTYEKGFKTKLQP